MYKRRECGQVFIEALCVPSLNKGLQFSWEDKAGEYGINGENTLGSDIELRPVGSKDLNTR